MRHAALLSTSLWLCWSHDCCLLCFIYPVPCICFPHRTIVLSLVVCISCSVVLKQLVFNYGSRFWAFRQQCHEITYCVIVRCCLFWRSIPLGFRLVTLLRLIELLDLLHIWWFWWLSVVGVSISGLRQFVLQSVSQFCCSWLFVPPKKTYGGLLQCYGAFENVSLL